MPEAAFYKCPNCRYEFLSKNSDVACPRCKGRNLEKKDMKSMAGFFE